MLKKINRKKGIALLLVLTTILIIVILANLTLGIMLSYSRNTLHKVSRIRAYYAGWAGVILAQERLRTNNWAPGNIYCIRTNPATGWCVGVLAPNIVDDAAIAYEVRINIMAVGAVPPGGASAIPGTAPIVVTTTYTYTE